ncbi:MAG: TatD family hydrolase [Rikenellaceae bacterium]
MIFTDTHSHLYSEQFEEDICQVVERAVKEGVTKMIIPATAYSNYAQVEELCAKFPDNMFAAYGLHPTDIDENTDIDFELQKLEEQIAKGGVVAIGETGLDMYWSVEHIDKQILSLRRHFELSIKYNLPLIIHVREAFDQIIEQLEPYRGKLRGVLHGFSGTFEQSQKILELGDFIFGIGGVVTFKKSLLPLAVAQIPLEKIVLETDSPYLTPTPFRGKRNESSYIPLIAKKIAEVKGIDIEVVARECEKNCKKMFVI